MVLGLSAAFPDDKQALSDSFLPLGLSDVSSAQFGFLRDCGLKFLVVNDSLILSEMNVQNADWSSFSCLLLASLEMLLMLVPVPVIKCLPSWGWKENERESYIYNWS